MNKPYALLGRTTGDLRGLLAGGKVIKTHELIAMAKWAIQSEIDERESDLDVLNFGVVPPEEAQERVEELEEEIEEVKSEHQKEIAALADQHEKALIEQAKIGSEITL